MGRPTNFDRISRQHFILPTKYKLFIETLSYKLKLTMNDLMKSDALLAIMAIVLGLVSTVTNFWEKITLIVLAVGIVALRSYLKSKETWRK